MINVNSVTNALLTTISSASTIVNSGINVCLNEVFNTDPNQSPWVGIYYGGTEIVPHRIGSSNPWRAVHDLRVYVQDSSMQSGQDANDRLDRLMWPVLSAVNSNKNLDATVHILENLNIDPYQRDIEDEQWMFTNEITLNYITDV